MRFGVIGGGLIAQIMHLPSLAELPAAEVHALADPGENVTDELGDRYNIDHQYQDGSVLIEEIGDELDAIVICTPMHTHADVAVQALEADINTFVEKPIALSLEDADRMVEAAKDSDATAMVGYMKRYEQGFQAAADRVTDMDVTLVNNFVFAPDVGTMVNETYDIIHPNLSEEFIEQSNKQRRDDAAQALDTDDDTLIKAFDFHLESICHDVNALRGLFGEIEEIDHVALREDGDFLTTQFTFANGELGVLESAATDRGWYDETIRADTPESMLEISFTNPFIRDGNYEVRIKEGKAPIDETRSTYAHETPFKRELAEFIRCIEENDEPLTTFADARKDLKFIANLFREYQ
ncbi:Gfo/Idh/MocA family oxidoreductase [Natronococcus sp. A-GB1]|uniref:Gfo/Idh/MocA family protein n=1 Tax=Natronococcus sp. A-GB1 TaxID=3037648 RepID=UPI00241F0CEC|nr:Gfo/Idh/MocA family oxidoreductase [Natronococcus sp. A-GB1]MDG5761665.1 Gfo/Idh/MocA family oxidoreductase [Natronococcus sp. A-GB1]